MALPPADLSNLPIDEVRRQMGELLLLCLSRSKIALFAFRDDSIITVIPTKVVATLDPETLAEALFDAEWEEHQIADLLEELGRLK